MNLFLYLSINKNTKAMNKNYLKTVITFICALIITNSFGQATKDGLWNLIPSKEIKGEKVRRNSFPTDYKVFQLNLNLLKSKLINAPVLGANTNQSSLILEFPNSEGNFEQFRVYESSIMDPILEAKFPMIKTYAAQGINDPTATMRFSVTQFGLHTMSLSGIKSTVYIDPYTSDLASYIVYDKNSLLGNPQTFACLTDENINLPSLQKSNAGALSVQDINDQKLRTFRLAQSCTGEYGAIFMGTGTVAQQKANVQAQMTITMNRVNGVYERDLAIHMNFIANNDLLIYLSSSTDPWSNEWNTKTAQTIDAAIGVANYDIGHNFNTTGGGNAGCIACVCLSTSQTATHKGRGYTGSTNPTGDAFDIDYVAHEMGHQYGGYHVMNTCSRSGNGLSEVEPASGSSVMGYAGICPSNIQAHSDDDFNYVNVRDISVNIKAGGNSTCAVVTTLTNTPPTASAGLDYTIPKSTAYILEGSGNDIDGMASLTYNWSQNDPAQSPGSAAPLSTYSVGPLYRSIKPSISPNRYMPALVTVLANTLASTWEVTPSVGRTLNFSLIVRDNTIGGGQTASDLMKVTVDGTSGPFAITSQSTATTWTATNTQTITWNVAGTSAGSVNTPSVNIFFSTDGGYTYPITLATGVLNNGSALITVPSVTTTTGRIMVRGAGNIFYDINNINIKIVAAPTIAPASNFSVASSNPCTASNIQLTDQSLNAPNSWTWTATSSTGVAFSNANAQNPTVTFANPGTYTVSLIAENSIGNNSSTKTITVNSTPAVAVNSSTICSGNSTALNASGATTYSWSNSASTSSISVSPNTTANYTVTGTSNGCPNSKIANVTVNNTPTVTVNSTTICSGNSANLTASGASTYSWDNGATSNTISVTPISNTTYTVTGLSNGCSSSVVSNVDVNSLPTISMVTSSTLVCVSDGTVSLNGTPIGGSFSGTGVTGNYFDPSVAGSGTFMVTYNYTDGNSCSNNDAKQITVNTCTGIKEITNASFVIFPNPTSGNFTIDFKSNSFDNVSFEVYDAIGKIVLKETVTNDITTVSLDRFAKGIYSVRIKTNNSYSVIRVIKE
jgi:hypothetical protein